LALKKLLCAASEELELLRGYVTRGKNKRALAVLHANQSKKRAVATDSN
jgi:hypothetical protein